MARKIMVALDGSSHSEQAIPHALGELGVDDELLIATVVEPVDRGFLPPAAAWPAPGLDRLEALDYLRGWSERLQQAGYRVHGLMEVGLAREQLVACAYREKPALLVLSSHGRHGSFRWLLGSVAETVCRLAPCPVLLANARQVSSHPCATVPEPEPRPRKILVPLDTTDLAATALKFLPVQETPRPTILLLTAIDMLAGSGANLLDSAAYRAATRALGQYLDGKVAELRAAGWTVEGRLESGFSRPSILQVAEEANVDRILMATHGRTGFGRWLSGSVAENVARLSPCPVMLVREALQEETDRSLA